MNSKSFKILASYEFLLNQGLPLHCFNGVIGLIKFNISGCAHLFHGSAIPFPIKVARSPPALFLS